jgi:hypothetical protein
MGHWKGSADDDVGKGSRDTKPTEQLAAWGWERLPWGIIGQEIEKNEDACGVFKHQITHRQHEKDNELAVCRKNERGLAQSL